MTPSQEIIEALTLLTINVLQPAREVVGPISVSSGYRPLPLNKYIGGSENSQHCKGEAADLICEDNAHLFDIIKKHLPFDQLIWEFGNDQEPAWVHVSYNVNSNRGMILRAIKQAGKTVYVPLS